MQDIRFERLVKQCASPIAGLLFSHVNQRASPSLKMCVVSVIQDSGAIYQQAGVVAKKSAFKANTYLLRWR
jgi:hypothetical protein